MKCTKETRQGSRLPGFLLPIGSSGELCADSKCLVFNIKTMRLKYVNRYVDISCMCNGLLFRLMRADGGFSNGIQIIPIDSK